MEISLDAELDKLATEHPVQWMVCAMNTILNGYTTIMDTPQFKMAVALPNNLKRSRIELESESSSLWILINHYPNLIVSFFSYLLVQKHQLSEETKKSERGSEGIVDKLARKLSKPNLDAAFKSLLSSGSIQFEKFDSDNVKVFLEDRYRTRTGPTFSPKTSFSQFITRNAYNFSATHQQVNAEWRRVLGILMAQSQQLKTWDSIKSKLTNPYAFTAFDRSSKLIDSYSHIFDNISDSQQKLITIMANCFPDLFERVGFLEFCLDRYFLTSLGYCRVNLLDELWCCLTYHSNAEDCYNALKDYLQPKSNFKSILDDLPSLDVQTTSTRHITSGGKTHLTQISTTSSSISPTALPTISNKLLAQVPARSSKELLLADSLSAQLTAKIPEITLSSPSPPSSVSPPLTYLSPATKVQRQSYRRSSPVLTKRLHSTCDIDLAPPTEKEFVPIFPTKSLNVPEDIKFVLWNAIEQMKHDGSTAEMKVFRPVFNVMRSFVLSKFVEWRRDHESVGALREKELFSANGSTFVKPPSKDKPPAPTHRDPIPADCKDPTPSLKDGDAPAKLPILPPSPSSSNSSSSEEPKILKQQVDELSPKHDTNQPSWQKKTPKIIGNQSAHIPPPPTVIQPSI